MARDHVVRKSHCIHVQLSQRLALTFCKGCSDLVSWWGLPSKSKEQNLPQFVALASGEVMPVEFALHLLRNGRVSRSAVISYSGLEGLQVEWMSDD